MKKEKTERSTPPTRSLNKQEELDQLFESLEIQKAVLEIRSESQRTYPKKYERY